MPICSKNIACLSRTVDRRRFLTGAASALLYGSTGLQSAAQTAKNLKDRASARGLTYGSMVSLPMLQSSSELREVIAREAAILVPGNEMKWRPTQPQRKPANYQAPDTIWKFASENGLALRGHTAAWHRNLPRWAELDLSGAGGRAVLKRRVYDIVHHFRGRVVEWDVVNEAIEPKDGLAGGLRNSPLYQAGGKSYVADCFDAAHKADPDTRLFYNEYGLIYRTPDEDRRREATLRLLSDLKHQGIPIDGLGIQCHLKVGNRFDSKVFRSFLADIAALDLQITITELDIDDERLPVNIAERDRAVADHARRFLHVALDEPALKSVLTWGLTDRYTWLNAERPRPDGVKKRPLPLDENLARKPLWDALAESFDNAPMRG